MPPGRWVPLFLDLVPPCRGILVRLIFRPTGCKLMRRRRMAQTEVHVLERSPNRPETSIAACSLGQGRGASGAGSASLDLGSARCFSDPQVGPKERSC